MTTRTSLLALAVLLISAMTAFAGMDYPMQCKNCGFTCRVKIGGGMGFNQITGFCVETGIYRHTDSYKPGSYRFETERTEIATGPGGIVF